MTWAKVDDNFHMHPKVLAAGNAAVGAWVRILVYCRRYHTDGLISEEALLTFASSEERSKLVLVRLLDDLGEGTFAVHNFKKWNHSSAEIERMAEAKSKQRAAAGRKGGVKSWESRRSKIEASTEAAREAAAEAKPKQTLKQNRSESEAQLPTTNSQLPTEQNKEPPIGPPAGDESRSRVMPKRRAVAEASPEAQEVFDHWAKMWVQVTGQRQPLLTPKRLRCIRARLAEGRTAQELKQAVDGIWRSQWHVENREVDIELVCRDDARVSKFLGLELSASAPKGVDHASLVWQARTSIKLERLEADERARLADQEQARRAREAERRPTLDAPLRLLGGGQ